MKSIDFISTHKSIRKLGLSACDVEDYSPLSSMNKLQTLILWKANKLQTLDILSSMTGLQLLFLQTVNNPTVFPKIEGLTKLRRLVFDAVKNIRDFTAIENVSSIKEFCFYDIKNQQPEDFIPILSNRNIENLYLWSLNPPFQRKMETLMAKYGRANEHINFLNDGDFVYD